MVCRLHQMTKNRHTTGCRNVQVICQHGAQKRMRSDEFPTIGLCPKTRGALALSAIEAAKPALNIGRCGCLSG